MNVLLPLFIVFWAAALQPDAEQTRILALENAWNLAEEHKDVKALETLLDSSLVYIDYDGSMMGKAQFIASVKAPSLHPEQIVNESMTAHVYGDCAVVTGVYREKGNKNGKRPISGTAGSWTLGCIEATLGFAYPASLR
jgi:ketosteroid isomerase-like protein